MVEYNCKCCGKPCRLNLRSQSATGSVDLWMAMSITKLCYKCYVSDK